VIELVNFYDFVFEVNLCDFVGYCDCEVGVGSVIGVEYLGVLVYEIDFGESVNLYYYEGVEEEWLLVFIGFLILCDFDGEY